MASKEILKQKEAVVAEISERLDNAKTFLLLNPKQSQRNKQCYSIIVLKIGYKTL